MSWEVLKNQYVFSDTAEETFAADRLCEFSGLLGFLIHEAILKEQGTAISPLFAFIGCGAGYPVRLAAMLNDNLRIVAIDSWKGTENGPVTKRLFDRFSWVCKDYEQQILPIRTAPMSGITLCKDAGLDVTAACIRVSLFPDSASEYVRWFLANYPGAHVFGDGADSQANIGALQSVAKAQGRVLTLIGTAWSMLR
jgi:hypothetical protein